MPGCRDCIHRIMPQRAASAGKLDLAPKAECKQHTGNGVIDLFLLSCDEHVQTLPIERVSEPKSTEVE